MGLLSGMSEASTACSGSLEEDELPDMGVRNTFFPTEPAPWGASLGGGFGTETAFWVPWLTKSEIFSLGLHQDPDSKEEPSGCCGLWLQCHTWSWVYVTVISFLLC